MASSGAASNLARATAASGTTSSESKIVVKFQNFRFPNYLLPSFDIRKWQRHRRRDSTSIDDSTTTDGSGRGGGGGGGAEASNNTVSDSKIAQAEGKDGEEATGGDNADSDASSVSSYNTTITSPLSLAAVEEAQVQGTTKHTSRKQAVSSSSSPLSKPKKKREPIVGSTTYMKCRKCQSDICFSSDIISKGFMGRHGRAYLIKSLPPHTHTLSKPISRQLVTGTHIVSDICCSVCQTNLGWKYLNAEEEGQRYKIGKYILETKKMVKVNRWEQTYPSDDDDDDGDNEDKKKQKGKEEEEGGEKSQFRLKFRRKKSSSSSYFSPVPPSSYPLKEQDMWNRELEMAEMFGDVNSEDDDELEDMFLGKWTPKLAAKRRKLWEKQQVTKDARGGSTGDAETVAPMTRRVTTPF